MTDSREVPGALPSRPGCPLCGGPSNPAFAVGDRNRGLGGERFDYRRCERCATTFIPSPPEDLGRYYAADGYGTAEEPLAGELEARERAKLELLLAQRPLRRLVEIGPGPGLFTRYASGAGLEVTAVEMDERYARRLAQLERVEVIRSDAPELVLPELGETEAVVMWHVLEHLPRPSQTLAAAVAALAPGGLLALSMPNPGSLQFRLLGRNWAHVDAPRHLQLIHLATLAERLAERGMRHVLTTTLDPVGLEMNRLGWEYAVRLHPARRPSTPTSMRLGKAITAALAPIERRGLAGAAYTAVFVREGGVAGSASAPQA